MCLPVTLLDGTDREAVASGIASMLPSKILLPAIHIHSYRPSLGVCSVFYFRMYGDRYKGNLLWMDVNIRDRENQNQIIIYDGCSFILNKLNNWLGESLASQSVYFSSLSPPRLLDICSSRYIYSFWTWANNVEEKRNLIMGFTMRPTCFQVNKMISH